MTAFQDRYIIMIGGYQYPNTYYFNNRSRGAVRVIQPLFAINS